MQKDKPAVMKRQMDVLNERYDLSNRPAQGVTMSRGKPLQEGVRAKLPPGVTSDQLAGTSPEDMQAKGLFPKGFLPLPHPNHAEGGMVFPQFHIDEIKKQEGRDLTRFDLDFDLPDHFLPEFAAPIYLTTRPDVGDVSQGKLVTIDNYYALFNGILNPKQLEGLRLLVTPFPQQQFHQTEDRRTERPSRGVACFECHANGHTNASTHLVGDIRPQEFRHRIDTPSLRGVHVQRLFGSQRALRSIEDFTEFEQRAAYFDGDPVIATKKGVNPLDRGSQVHFMAELQELLDFPPAPKLKEVALPHKSMQESNPYPCARASDGKERTAKVVPAGPDWYQRCRFVPFSAGTAPHPSGEAAAVFSSRNVAVLFSERWEDTRSAQRMALNIHTQVHAGSLASFLEGHLRTQQRNSL
jgi:cytochrome c peroxidase